MKTKNIKKKKTVRKQYGWFLNKLNEEKLLLSFDNILLLEAIDLEEILY